MSFIGVGRNLVYFFDQIIVELVFFYQGIGVVYFRYDRRQCVIYIFFLVLRYLFIKKLGVLVFDVLVKFFVQNYIQLKEVVLIEVIFFFGGQFVFNGCLVQGGYKG